MGNLTKKTITRGAVVALALSAGAATTANAAVTRTSGADRYATATQIFNSWPTTPTTAVLAAGVGHDVDALTVAPLAKMKNAPVILVDTKATVASIVAQFSTFTTVYIANGTGVVSADVEAALKAAGKTVVRLGGADRTETALNIAKQIGAANGIVVANGDDSHLVDTLSIASIAAAKGMPIFLTSGGSLSTGEATYAKGLGATNVYALGGTTVVTDAAAAGLGTTVTRLAGAGRYETNAKIVTQFKADLDLSNIYVASGEDANLIDALAGAPLAGLKNAPIVFAHDSVNADVNTLLNAVVTDTTKVVILGGTGAVSAAVETSLNTVQASKSADFKVQGIVALNASQIKVTFTQAVAYGTGTGAQAAANYGLYTATTGSISISSAVVQSDKKSVILNLTTPIANSTNGTDIAVTVRNILLSTNSAVAIPLYTGVVNSNDKTAPDVASVTSSTNTTTADKVVISFTEPLSGTAAVKIDGTTYATASSTDSTTGVTKLTVSGLTLDTAATHTVQVVNATDGASNVNALITKTFSITKDTVAPQVASITQYSDDTLLVKFDKDMTAVTTSDISVADSSLNAITVASIKQADTSDLKTWEVVLANGSLYTNSTTNTLTVLFKASLTDTLTNAMTAVAKSVTLTQDTTAPNVTSVVVNKNASGQTTGITVNFDSKLDDTTATNLAKITVVNSNGVIDTTTFASLGAVTPSYGATSVTLNMTAATLTGKYGFSFASGFVKDLSIAKNASNSYSQSVDFGSASTSSSWAFASNGGTVTTASNVLTVTFPYAVKGGAVTGSATDPNNYTLNGTTLPANTTITLNSAGSPSGSVGQTIATITLPASSVATTDTAAVFTIQNVQRTSDSLPIAVATTAIGITDNTRPVLQTAVLDSYSNGATTSASFILTYNEGMNAATLANSEFTINVNGTDLVATAEAIATVPGYSKKLVLTFTTTHYFDASKVITIKTNGSTTATPDKAGNVQTNSVLLTVTK